MQNNPSKSYICRECYPKISSNYNNCIDYINEVLHEGTEDDQKQTKNSTIVNPSDDWDDGLTFTARTSRKFIHTKTFLLF